MSTQEGVLFHEQTTLSEEEEDDMGRIKIRKIFET